MNPLWIPALVDREGWLARDRATGAVPWVPRLLLAPLPGGSLTLGSLAALDRFLTLHPVGEAASGWPAFWSFSRELFRSVVSQEIETFSLPQYETHGSAYVLDLAAPLRTSGHLVALYDHLLAAEKVPALLARVLRRARPRGPRRAGRRPGDPRPLRR